MGGGRPNADSDRTAEASSSLGDRLACCDSHIVPLSLSVYDFSRQRGVGRFDLLVDDVAFSLPQEDCFRLGQYRLSQGDGRVFFVASSGLV